MKNIAYASRILQELWRQGVREVMVCAGARNAPLVTVLSSAHPFRVHSFFDERSAGFFALGRMLSTGRPAAVITTSGTAVAELLPATIEADYQRLPLWLVTADRPREYRGTAAPQAIVQPGIFSHYVEKTWDLSVGDGFSFDEVSGARPAHVNLCFDEPLIDDAVPAWPQDLSAKVKTSAEGATRAIEIPFRRPLILVAGLRATDREDVIKTLSSWRRPVYLEGPSGLRGHSDLREWEILGGEKTLAGLDYDSVIRIGTVPTVRLWRDLEKSNLPVVHFSHAPFTGLARGGALHSIKSLSQTNCEFESWAKDEKQSDRQRAERLTTVLEKYPLSEPAWVRRLSRELPQRARFFIGNSLPIREWDLAAAQRSDVEVFANRGVNGIDGLISTFLGVSESDRSNWALIGDLSALYDLSGPWALRGHPMRDVNLVVLNNGGGKIFERMFHNPLFENRHDLNLQSWAKLWDWDYVPMSAPTEWTRASRPRVIEIFPSTEETAAFWREWSAE